MNQDLYELLQKWQQLLPHLKRKRLGPNLDVMVGFGLKHAFPELPLWGNLSFTCTLLSTKPPKPWLNQTKPHKSPLHSCNSINTEMDLPEISQIPGWQRQSKWRNGIPVQRSACLLMFKEGWSLLIPFLAEPLLVGWRQKKPIDYKGAGVSPRSWNPQRELELAFRVYKDAVVSPHLLSPLFLPPSEPCPSTWNLHGEYSFLQFKFPLFKRPTLTCFSSSQFQILEDGKPTGSFWI